MMENSSLTSELAQLFEERRPRLRAVARRLLGSSAEADDAVQETWLRLSATDTSAIDNLGGWLTTVVSRVSLDMLRSRAARREVAGVAVGPDDGAVPEPAAAEPGPAERVAEADAVGSALLVVLDALAPAERLAFVLHDVFAVPFDQIAGIVDTSVPTARQLASRARRRVRGAGAPEPDRAREREVVEAFLEAAREGRFERLLGLLDPKVVLRADDAVVRATQALASAGAPLLAPELTGAEAVAHAFLGRAAKATVVLADYNWAFGYAAGDTMRAIYLVTLSDDGDRIAALDAVADPETIAAIDVTAV
ncbi:sigma-70 family RNA polymerase sigma factor [Myceligenerans crystallogenes]|uniref:Sigma-70 family RNA polymerase sigma factor n=1 Tax=Myceligenerans crystallogenes TaxID=316335 RepID=A0ABN2NLU7_9MICO